MEESAVAQNVEDDMTLRDLKDPSQISKLLYYDNKTNKEVTSYDQLVKKISRKLVDPTAIWVQYEPVTEDGSRTEAEVVPWVGIYADKMGDVLLSYIEKTPRTTKNKLIKKACTEMKRCMQDENLCAQLIEQHKLAYGLV